jgi:chromosome segregation ATPase
MSVCFPAPLDENMRLKLILQRRVTEVRALQELRAQQERRKQHIVDLRSRLEHRKRECVEAVEQCKRRAEEQEAEEERVDADARESSARISSISKSAREMEKETEKLKEGLVGVADERSRVEAQLAETMASLKERLGAATSAAGESASDFDRCHRACVQQSTQLKTLTKQSEMLTKLCDAWEAGLVMIRDIPRGNQPVERTRPAKLQTSLARSHRSRFGWFLDESIALVEFSKQSRRTCVHLFEYAHIEVGSKI